MNTANISTAQYAKCHAIIHGAGAACGLVGLGLAQLPLSDSAVITPIQISMTIALGKVFGIELTQSAAEAPWVAAVAAMVGRAASQVLVGWVPGIGNIVNCGTALAITEGIGWLLVEQFSNGVSVS